ncbi:MAG: hypothetical protein IR526_03855 [Bordetella sp.]|nr:MAG: hypothetical protein IR526_03855 [Bordetella sp.]
MKNIFPQNLFDGYKIFIEKSLQNKEFKYRFLAHNGQNPNTILISCCDSRVPPELIFNLDFGEVFVIRNMANLILPYQYENQPGYQETSEALSLAINSLNIKNIVVLGHSFCNGVRYLLNNRNKKLKIHIG